MFTGIVTAIGDIIEVASLGQDLGFGKRLRLKTPAGYLADVELGDSVALNGACMTVVAVNRDAPHFDVQISAESLARTAALDQPGRVNLELALRAGDRMGGHLVAGHVDGIGRVTRFQTIGESRQLEVMVPNELARFVAVKGSVVLNGVSLTVNHVADNADGCRMLINLVPHTLQCTTLGALQAENAVNLEVDLIARYVERLLHTPAP